jgi:two-component system, NtrC family, response regulator HydG
MEQRARILVVDDHEPIRRGLQTILSELGYAVDVAPDAESGLKMAMESPPDLVIIDLNLPGKSGLELVADLQERGEEATLVVLTGHGSIDSAVEATRRGVFDYLVKPVQPGRLKTVIDRGLERTALRREVIQLRREVMRTGRLHQLVGRSPRILELYRMIEQVASSTATVLITGESGTGKDLVARTLHQLSPRASRPFVAVNCAAIPATLLESEIFGHEKGAFTGASAMRTGCFEQAHEGSLFLDEIAEMPADLQSKLLRVLEDRKFRRVGGNRELTVDVRVIAATNADVKQLRQQGRLREDLYFRLNVFTLHIPPLRERSEDIPVLVEHFLEEFRREERPGVAGFSAAALELLTEYRWPGNIRELRNVVQRAVLLCAGGEIQPEHLPGELRGGSLHRRSDDNGSLRIPIGTSVAAAERRLIVETLRALGGDKPKAAEVLGISLKTLYTRLHKYDESSADEAAR